MGHMSQGGQVRVPRSCEWAVSATQILILIIALVWGAQTPSEELIDDELGLFPDYAKKHPPHLSHRRLCRLEGR